MKPNKSHPNQDSQHAKGWNQPSDGKLLIQKAKKQQPMKLVEQKYKIDLKSRSKREFQEPMDNSWHKYRWSTCNHKVNESRTNEESLT